MTPFREPIHYITSFRICQAVFLKKLNFSFFRPPPKRCDLGKLIYYITSVRFCQVHSRLFSKFPMFYNRRPRIGQLLYYITIFALCQQFFYIFFIFGNLMCNRVDNPLSDKQLAQKTPVYPLYIDTAPSFVIN